METNYRAFLINFNTKIFEAFSPGKLLVFNLENSFHNVVDSIFTKEDLSEHCKESLNAK